MRHLDSPEGLTVLAAAIIDDVPGVVVLAVVVGIADEGSVTASSILINIFAKAVGFWLGLTVIWSPVASHIGNTRAFRRLQPSGLMARCNRNAARGEVALIAAGIALTSGVIRRDVFGVAIVMTVVTTTLAPILLVPSFRNGTGLRSEENAEADKVERK